MLSIPRALPPVTQSSAFQAPERLRGNLDVFVQSVYSVVENNPEDWGLLCFCLMASCPQDMSPLIYILIPPLRKELSGAGLYIIYIYR